MSIVPKKSSRGRYVYGAKPSLRLRMRTHKARLLMMPWKLRLTILTAVAVLGGIMSTAYLGSPLPGAGIAIGLSLLVVVILTASNALINLGIIATTSIILFPLGFLFVSTPIQITNSPTPPPSPDVVGGVMNLLVWYAICVYLGSRWSRGRTWVTTLLLSLSLLPSMFLVASFPWLGLNAPRILFVLVLLVRCGGVAWIVGSVRVAVDRIQFGHKSFATTPLSNNDVTELDLWANKTLVERRTAWLLHLMGKKFSAFHDVRMKGVLSPIQHFVVGPSGCIIIASISTSGEMVETPKEGLTLPGNSLGSITGSMLEQRIKLSKRLKVRPEEILMLITVYGESGKNQDLNKIVSVFDGTDPLPTASVKLVSPENLVKEVERESKMWTFWKIQQTLLRVRTRLLPATIPTPFENGEFSETPNVFIDIDNNGNITRPGDRKTVYQSWMKPGANVNVSTSNGIKTDACIAGTLHNVDSVWTLPIAIREQWEQKSRGNRSRLFTFLCPIEAIQLYEELEELEEDNRGDEVSVVKIPATKPAKPHDSEN